MTWVFEYCFDKVNNLAKWEKNPFMGVVLFETVNMMMSLTDRPADPRHK
jgi:hypothetical protein